MSKFYQLFCFKSRCIFIVSFFYLNCNLPVHAQQTDSLYCKGFYLDTTVKRTKVINYSLLGQTMSCNFSGVTVVPVVVHVIHQGEPVGTGANISTADIISQLELLNQCFRKTNVNPNLYNGIAADVKIEFQLARSKPNGLPHDGITRDYWAGTPPFTKSYIDNNIKPATIWDPDRYLNIWITDPADNNGQAIGGYATFPANTGLNGQNEMNSLIGSYTNDGVVITKAYVNQIPGYSALAHEVGHYLGLFHTFMGTVGDISNCLSINGDYCDDTPPTAGHVFGNPSLCTDYYSCLSNRDMTENFMDYSVPCQQIFTNDQKARMLVSLNSIRRPDHLSYYSNEWQGLDTYEPNGSPATSANIFPLLSSTPVDSLIHSYIFHQNDYDWFKINIDRPGKLTVTLNGLSQNYNLEIYGPNGLSEWIDGSYNTSTLTDQLVYDYTSSSTSVMYVTSYGYNNVSDKCADYALRLQWQPASSCIPIVASISKTDLTSAGANNGTASVSVSSGSSPFTYLWSNGITTSSISNLSPGTYQVTVRGNDSCESRKNIYVGTQGVQQPYCYGTTTLTASSGTFSDGSTNSYYSNNSFCSWKIDPSINNATITLTFSEFQLASGDTVIVYNGSNSNAPVLGKFYGTFLPPQVISSVATMFVLFKSNSTDTLGGWTASYTSQVIAGGTSIVQYEYWFDNNYANSQILNLTPKRALDLNVDLPVSLLTQGMHILNIRFLDDNNKWSSVLSSFFIKNLDGSSTSKNIVAYEYWYDSDYANKISQTVSPLQVLDLSTPLNMTAASDGMHILNIRFKDNGNFWSSVLSQFVIKYPSGSNSNKHITEYEYWFDNNYASKTNQTVTPQISSIINTGLNVSSLSNGMHTLNIRFKDDGNFWSSVLSSFFIRNGTGVANVNNITAYRYWYDTTYTNITTVLLPTPVNPYDLVTNINTASLSSGKHMIHFQFKDSINLWSGVTNDTFNNVLGPHAAFVANDTTLCYSGTVTFTNLSTNATSYQWTFGDGGSSTSTSPSHNYTSGGLYTVRLIAIGTGNFRDTLTYTNYVRVTIPNVTVSPNVSVCPGGSTPLTASGGASYTWYPPVGLSATIGPNVTASPTSTTIYNVIGTDTYGCIDTAQVKVTVSNLVTVLINPVSATICSGNSVNLTASGANTFSWYPSIGLNTTTGATVTASPNSTTTFYAIGTAACGIDTESITVTVNQTSIANAGRDTSICYGKTVSLSASGGNTYSWSNGATTSLNTVSPSTQTIYTVTVTSNNCSATDTVVVNVNPSPFVSINDTSICSGSTITLNAGNSGASYLWNDNTTAQTHTVTIGGTYSVVVTNTYGCSADDEATVVVANNLNVQINDTSICQGNTTVLNAGFPGSTYHWSTNESSQTITVSSANTYSVTVTHASGCTGSDAAVVVVNPKPVADAGNNIAICSGEQTLLSATGGSSFQWSNGTNTPSNSVTPNTSTTYYVTVTDNNGCTANDSVKVAVNQLPVVTLDSFNSVCNDASSFLLGGGNPTGGNYSGVGVSSNSFSPIVAGNGIHLITYAFSDSNGCKDSAQRSILVTNCTGIKNNSISATFEVFPNPTIGLVNIVAKDLAYKSIVIEVTNALGQKLNSDTYITTNTFSTKYDMSLFSPGVYFFKITTQEKSQIFEVLLEK